VASTGLKLTAVRRTRVSDGVAAQLRRLLEEGALRPGDMLPPERELAERFGVSRSSVRDAIRTLELVGMVEARQGEGTVVADASPDALVVPLAAVIHRKREMVGDLLDVRKMLEPALAARAARHATSEEIAHMEEVLRRQEERIRAGQPAVEEDGELHYAIAMAAGNAVVRRMVDVLMDLLRESRARSLQVRGRAEKSLSGHRRVVAAIRRGDAAAAEAAMRSHLRDIENVVLKKL
jgi:GntR family transcriptional regulator, transcriptional repressor for pyruvate dehydrogenase complex